MQNDDGTKEKSKEKERVLAAITALKTQGADINPYTVSGEAQVPRSTLYRDPELMDLIYRERNADSDGGLSNDEQTEKISELEASNQTLNEQIWELEKQLESMTKAKQDAYVQGFQAGIEEAVKRYGINTSETAARANLQHSFEAPSFEAPREHEAPAELPREFEAPPSAEQFANAAHETAQAQARHQREQEESEYEEPYSFESELLEQGSLHSPSMESTAETQYVEQPVAAEPVKAEHSENRAGNERRKYNDLREPSGEFEPLGSNYDFGRSPQDAYVARNYQFGGGSLMAEEPDMGGFAPEPQNEVAPESGDEHNIFDDIESVLSADSSEPEPEQAPAPAPKKSSRPDIDFSLSSERDDEPPPAAAPKKSGFPDIDFGLSSDDDNNQAPQPAYEPAAQHEHHQPEFQPAAAAAMAEVARDPDAIYNIARSGPTISSSAYNPLVELSWKDLQTVYNFSVASLKDYAKPGFGAEPSPMGGTNFADKTTQQPPMRAKQVPQNPNRTADRLEPASLPHEQYRHDPRRTGDKLQAMSDPRNLFETEPIVDLDALDIFDDLDDYVDLDKIEVINDVVTKPKKEEPEEPSKGGDELRELIKGRIKQAAEIGSEPAPRMGMGMGGLGGGAKPAPGAAASAAAANTAAANAAANASADAAKDEDGKAAAAGGARNKFIGGAKTHEPPPQGPNVFVKQIPPEIRRSAMILGIKAEEATQKSVIEAWKKQIASPGVHPDLGGDTEAAVFLNTAKDTMVRWLDAQAPKLGKKFGGGGQPPKDPPKK
ncbi:MAG TPA: hypothetical protein V6C76_13375 [Drouetiella sp.]